MDQEITYCGLVCETCLIHLATLEPDINKRAEMRISIARELARVYGTTPKPEIISDCDGCKTTGGRLFTGCAECSIRKCAMARNIQNCALCDDYPCTNLNNHFVFDPGSRERLDNIRNKS